MPNIRHAFKSLISDDTVSAGQGKVLPSHWNAQLVYTNSDGTPSGTSVFLRKIADAGFTVYVSPTGNDTTGDGSQANPFLTPQHAFDWSEANLDGGTLTGVTIQMADGTYAATTNNALAQPAVVAAFSGYNVYTFNGNSNSPGNVKWDFSANSAYGFLSQFTPGTFYIQNLQIYQSTPNAGSNAAAIAVFNPSLLTFTNVIFGACSASDHIWAGNGAQIIGTSYTISGAAANHILCDDCLSQVQLSNTTVTITGTPAFGEFATLVAGGVVLVRNVTFNGSATGPRFSIAQGSNLVVLGANSVPLGLTALPGNAAGTSDGTATYNNILVGGGGKLISALPSGAAAGTRDFVTNANNTLTGGIGLAAVASTTTSTQHAVPVIYDGTNWLIG